MWKDTERDKQNFEKSGREETTDEYIWTSRWNSTPKEWLPRSFWGDYPRQVAITPTGRPTHNEKLTKTTELSSQTQNSNFFPREHTKFLVNGNQKREETPALRKRRRSTRGPTGRKNSYSFLRDYAELPIVDPLPCELQSSIPGCNATPEDDVHKRSAHLGDRTRVVDAEHNLFKSTGSLSLSTCERRIHKRLARRRSKQLVVYAPFWSL